MCRTEGLYLKAFPAPWERSVWLLTNFSAGKGLNLSSWSESSCQLLKTMQKQENVFLIMKLEVGLRSTGKIHWIFKNYFLMSIWLFSNYQHVECNDRAVPKSMFREKEVVIGKNPDLSRRQEYFSDSWKSGVIREVLEWLAPGKHCRVRTFFRE